MSPHLFLRAAINLSTSSSFLYTSNPISIQGNTVLRAASFKYGWIKSPTKTSTFILESGDINFPTIFLSTDPDNFFDYNTGIYEMGPNASQDYPHFGANFWEDWEKPIFLELLENDGTYFSSAGGVKIFGGQAAVAGNILVRQRGTGHNPGENVYAGKAHTLHARVDGIVKFQKKKNNKSYVSIVPFEA